MQTLSSNGIWAAPLYDAASDKFLGFIDMLDIASAAVQVARSAGKFARGTGTSRRLTAQARRTESSTPESIAAEEEQTETMEAQWMLDELNAKTVTGT